MGRIAVGKSALKLVCCASVKTEVLRAAGGTDLLGGPLSFVRRPDRWAKAAFGEYRATCALGRPHGEKDEEA